MSARRRSIAPAVVLAIVTVGLPLVFGGCNRPAAPAEKEPPAAIRDDLRKVEEGQTKREAARAEYKLMSVPDLAKKLAADSTRGVEPFNSLAYREAVSREKPVARELSAQIKDADRSSFLALLAIRKLDPEAYRTFDAKKRATILADALKQSKTFNAWGIPHLYWEDAGKAFIELGEAAVGPLKAMLKDERAAPLWGSEEAAEYQKYKYRLKDYAWLLMLGAESKKTDIPTDPAARDRLIAGR
jgi:hypothetical protein